MNNLNSLLLRAIIENFELKEKPEMEYFSKMEQYSY